MCERPAECSAKGATPFMQLPLSGPNKSPADSDTVLARLTSSQRLWVQGAAGMGKTAMFRYLIEQHFAGEEVSAFSIFKRSGYILVPIEARRFPAGTFEEK